MIVEDIKREIEKITKTLIEDMGFELFEIEFAARKGKHLLRIFIDKDDGVSLDDCEKVSREVSTILDVEDIIPSSYVLEVSSPGLDRPLRNPQDFKRFRGNMARIVTREPVENQTFFQGIISNADDNTVELILEKNRSITIPYNIITRSRLEVEF
jgi:ribosome maturation factor RimP